MKNPAVLKLICLFVFVGWMVIWIVLPTEIYKYNWLPKLSKSLDATYIGKQGTNLLLLTFPMMFIAVIGCIYLHLKNKREVSLRSGPSQRHVNYLRRPLLVMGPLGIVTAMELIFAFMGIALVCWHFGSYFYVSVKHPHMGHGPDNRQLWQKRFRSVSLRLGYASNIAWGFLFFPVTRLTSILPLVGLTYESSVKYHVWIGQLVMVLSALHSIGFIIYWAFMNQMSEMLDWSKTHVSNLAGEISWVFLLAIWFTSFAYTRRKAFELFFYTHQLYILATFFYLVHIGVSWTMQILPGIFLFIIDRYLRFLQSRSHVSLISARLLPGETVEMTFSKSPGVHYDITSFVFVNVPKFSKLQWHPFTVISNNNMEPDKLSIAFKCEGSWSKKMYKQLSSTSIDRLQVSVEGPYGPASISFLKHEALVLISGGSGITPFISIIREIIFQSNNRKGQVPKILLICAFKNAVDLTILDLLLPIGSSLGDLSNVQLEIQAYVTREDQPPASECQKLVHTKQFKLSPLDSPITPILGPNSWLYLCVIIASSFVLFILLLALVTQYHIYPKDLNTNKKYHFTLWVLWDLFFMCISIILVISIVFLLQKKKYTAEDQKQVRNVEVPTPESSPGSWFSFGDQVKELESLPHQALVQATQVHYGRRPDIRKILSESKEQDIGVLASGPAALKQDVARICSGVGATNLHFEYLSYTW